MLRVLREAVQQLASPQLAQAVAEGVPHSAPLCILGPPARLLHEPPPPRNHASAQLE